MTVQYQRVAVAVPRQIMEEQGAALTVETQETAAPIGPSSIPPSVEIEMRTITHVFREVLVQHLDALRFANSLRFLFGSRYSTILDAIKKGRREGMEELLRSIDEMQDKRGVFKIFMDKLKHSGHEYLHDVITGNQKLDDNWELKNLLLKTEVKLLDVPPLELLQGLKCFDNFEKEAIRSTERNHGATVACSELFLRLQSKHPRIIDELIDALKEIKYPDLAKSLEDAYKDNHKEQKSSGDPDGHDSNGDGEGPSQDPHDEEKPDDNPESGSHPDASGAAGGHDEMTHGESGSGDQGRSTDDGESGDGNVPQMLHFLELSDSSKSASSSATSVAESKNTGKSNGASSCSAPMSIGNLKLYDYQEELAEHALARKNSVIVAPTGSGKTRVAVAIAIKALTEKEGNKVIFVVNKVALVEQQKNAFQEFIPEVVGISGDMSSQVPLVHQLQQADVIVLTAQILLNALQDGSFSLTYLRLLILDECHNTQKDSSYNSVMAYYRDLKKEGNELLPQVVGLTASLGVKKAKRQTDAVKHVLKLCANLDAQEISRVVKFQESLRKSYHRPKEESFGVRGRDDRDPFKIKLGLVMDRIEQAIFSNEDGKKILGGQKGMEMSSHRGTQQYEGEVAKLLEQIPIKVANKEAARVLQDCALFLKIYNQALYINRDARTVDALNHISSYIQELQDMQQDTQDSVKRLIALFGAVKPEIEEICRGPNNQNPVLQRLETILIQEYDEKPETLAILFTNTRDSTRALQAWIQDTEALEFLKPGTLIGTGGNTGMTQTQQEQLLAMFKEKKHKLVISTSVAEEGLDIQMCNLVIRYNYVRDDIGRVQARGRSRAEGGKFYLVYNTRLPKLADRERMNKGRELMMEQATEAVCQMIQKKPKEYQDNIAELQRLDASERSLQMSGRLAAEKKKSSQKVHSDVKLLCKHCRQFTCYTDDIRCINGQHHIVVKEDFEDHIITERLQEERDLYKDVKVSKEIQCQRCRKQLGYMMIFREHELPLISIRFLVIELRKGVRIHKKKWSETTSIFTIKDIDLEDLAERLKVTEEEEEEEDETDGAVNEKEQ